MTLYSPIIKKTIPLFALTFFSWFSSYSQLASPNALTFSNVTSSSFDAAWNATGSDMYILFVSTDSSFNVNALHVYPTGFTTQTVTGLLASTKYYCRMRSRSYAGEQSAYSRTWSVTLPATATGNLAMKRTLGTTNTSGTVSTFSTLAASTQNYVSATDVLVSGFTLSTQVDAATRDQQSTVYTYCDGLGRPNQTVSVQSSPLKRDIIQPVVYDPFGREFRKYLPFVADGSGYRDNTTIINATTGAYMGDAANFYNNAAIADDGGKPFAETRFEPSSISRTIEQGAPGPVWQPDATDSYTSTDRTIKFAYETNAANEVRLWTYSAPTTANPSGVLTSAFYSANQLYKTKTKDEQYHEVIEYKDKEGKVVLKKVQAPGTNTWAETHYVYDDFSNLVCVIQPEGASRISEYFAASDVDKAAFLNRWTFCYSYDRKKRMTMKQVPGAAAVYMVYDTRDRLVMTQDGNQRLTNQWMFTKYDILNRSIVTGIYTHPSALDQIGMQSFVNGLTVFYETYNGVAASYGYTNTVFPVSTFTGTFDPLTVTYYDTYTFKETFINAAAFGYLNTELDGTGGYVAQNATANQYALGQVTGTGVRMISSGTWLKSVHYYDNKYRLIQTISDNTKGHEITTTTYDFVGKPLRTKTSLYTGQPVTWSNVIGATVSGNSVSFTGTGSAWSQGAMSTQVLPANADGWFEITVPQTDAGFMIGLADQFMGPVYTNIDFAWYVSTSQLSSSENGTIVARGGVVPGDVLRIERINGKIVWKRNGIIVYAPSTTTTANTAALFVYLSLKTTGSKISNVVVSNKFNISTFTATSSVIKRFGYDHAGRLVDTWHKVTVGATTGSEILLTHNSYNELGQLIDKKLHSTVATAADAKQSVDYRYNIRGWLTSINNAELSNIGTNDDTDDLFGMNLAYNDDLGTGNSTNLQYNGNINAIKWSTGLGQGAIKQMGYNFTYDAMNRLSGAASLQAATLNTWAAGQYDENGLSYDLNGNIKNLQRKGKGNVVIDNLTYNYGSAFGNQLMSVGDGAATADKDKGFYDGNTSGNDYAYDANGNMTQDKNKNLVLSAGQSITYNHLNLPEKVTKYGNDNIVYLYDATGAKRSQVVTQSGTQKVTEYVGPWVFENNVLQFIQHDEGRVVIASEQKLYTNSCDVVTTDLTTTNATLAAQTINGEKYIKVTSTSSPAAVKGGLNFSTVYTVAEGERYLFRVKGYFNGAAVTLYAKGNSTDLVWPGTTLPKQALSETWVEETIVIPNGITQLTLGVLWGGAATTTDNFLINEVEFYKLGNNAAPEYQYHLKDHLGNVRVTFTSQPQTKTYSAGFETANQATEAGNFKNYPSGARINTAAINAHGGSNSQYLSGGLNGQVGVAKSFSVMPRDQLQVQAYVKFGTASSTASNLNGFAAALLGAFGLSAPVGGEAHTASSAINAWGALEAGGNGDGSTAPVKVFVNILLFDKDYNFLDIAYQAVSTSGALLSASYTVKEPGYAYMYISNENATLVDVYVDDVTMSVTPSMVVSEQSYYPFGLTSQSYSRENSVPNKFKFQGQEHNDDLGLGWDSFKWRNHQPDIGRFFGVDKLAEKYYYNSPYAFSENKVVAHRELEGLEAVEVRTGYSQTVSNINGSPVYDNKEQPWKVGRYDVSFTLKQTETYDLVENNTTVGSGERVTLSNHKISLRGSGLPIAENSKDNKVANFLISGMKRFTVEGSQGIEMTTTKSISLSKDTKGKKETTVETINTGQVGLNENNTKTLKTFVQRLEQQYNSAIKQLFRFDVETDPRKKGTVSPGVTR